MYLIVTWCAFGVMAAPVMPPQSLEKEALSLESRLSCARADLQKADHVRETLDGMRDQDEVGRKQEQQQQQRQ